MGYTRFFWVIMGYIGLQWYFSGFQSSEIGFGWVALGFSGSYWVITGYTK